MQLKIVVTGLETPYVPPEHASHSIELVRQVCMITYMEGELIRA
jgi:hypothetical protein